MLISVIGLGWFGTPLAHALKEEGHEVLGTTRSIEKQRSLQSHGIRVFLLAEKEQPAPELLNVDIIVLNIPPHPEQLKWFKSWQWNKKTWIIFISSTSVFSTPEGILKEEEDWFQSNFEHWTVLRFGGLLGGDRHPGKHLSGKKNLKDGDKMVNLLMRDHAIESTVKVIREKKQREIIRVVNIENKTRREFYTEYCRQKGLPLPEFD